MRYQHDVALAKIRPPRAASASIERDKAVARLEQCLTRKIVTVEAPLGYAKTAFLVEAHQKLRERSGRWVTLWYSADRNDDLEHLCRYLLEALREVFPALDPEELMGLFRESVQQFTATLSNYLMSDAIDHDKEYVLFIDDLGKVDYAVVGEVLNSIAKYYPDDFHVVASGNHGLWESIDIEHRDDVSVFPTSALALDQGEVLDLLELTLSGVGYDITTLEHLADDLQRVTGGWALGVRTYADALSRGIIDITDEVEQQSLGQQLNRFYRESVLDSLPAGLAEFVLATALTDTTNAELCDALTLRDDSKFVLRDLEARGVFINQCSDYPGCYMYQPLFHRWLRRKQRQMDVYRLRDLCRTASDWFAEHGMDNEAAKYMLMESDSSFVEALAAAIGYGSQRNGLSYFDWVASIEPRRFSEDPHLALQVTWGYICSGRAGLARQWADRFEESAEGMHAADAPDSKLAADLVRGKCLEMECDYETAVEVNEAILRERGDDLSLPQRCLITHSLADAYVHLGRFHEALRNYLQAEVMAELGKSDFFVALCRMGIIWLRILQGEFTGALELADKALGECPKTVAAHGALLSAKAYILVESGKFDEATICAEQARIELALVHNIDMVYENEAVIAQCLSARGLGAQAFRMITKTALTVDGANVARSVDLLVYLVQARVALAMGYYPEAKAAVMSLCESAGEHDTGYRLLARATDTLVENLSGNPASAFELLEYVDMAAESGLGLCELELCIAVADCYAWEDMRTEALVYMNRALRIQAKQGIVSPFLRSGGQTRSLLHEIVDVRKSGGRTRTLAKAVLREFGAVEPEDEAVDQTSNLVVRFGLTDRECEVLELLDAGMSRREIAETLMVSINTVKSHMTSIYSKLGVTNRIDAFAIVHGEQ